MELKHLLSQKAEDYSDKNTSIYHNCQKHLVTTLKNVITLDSFNLSPESYELEKKLWQTFLKGTKLNKTLIALTLVSFDFAFQS